MTENAPQTEAHLATFHQQMQTLLAYCERHGLSVKGTFELIKKDGDGFKPIATGAYDTTGGFGLQYKIHTQKGLHKPLAHLAKMAVTFSNITAPLHP